MGDSTVVFADLHVSPPFIDWDDFLLHGGGDNASRSLLCYHSMQIPRHNLSTNLENLGRDPADPIWSAQIQFSSENTLSTPCQEVVYSIMGEFGVTTVRGSLPANLSAEGGNIVQLL